MSKKLLVMLAVIIIFCSFSHNQIEKGFSRDGCKYRYSSEAFSKDNINFIKYRLVCNSDKKQCLWWPSAGIIGNIRHPFRGQDEVTKQVSYATEVFKSKIFFTIGNSEFEKNINCFVDGSKLNEEIDTRTSYIHHNVDGSKLTLLLASHNNLSQGYSDLNIKLDAMNAGILMPLDSKLELYDGYKNKEEWSIDTLTNIMDIIGENNYSEKLERFINYNDTIKNSKFLYCKAKRNCCSTLSFRNYSQNSCLSESRILVFNIKEDSHFGLSYPCFKSL